MRGSWGSTEEQDEGGLGGIPQPSRAGAGQQRVWGRRGGGTLGKHGLGITTGTPCSSFSVTVLGGLIHLFFFFFSVFLSPPRAVMVTQWIRTNAAHYVTCPLPQQWWPNRITKGKSMPKG